MKKMMAAVLMALFVPLAFAGSDEVQYQGGTLAMENGTKLKVNLADPAGAVLTGKHGAVRIPWAGISSIEYGQTASRRVTSSVLLLGPMGLFLKAQKHYVSVEWTDAEGNAQAAAFRADKNNFRAILSAFRAKSKVVVVCGDAEAAKYFACESSATLVAK